MTEKRKPYAEPDKRIETEHQTEPGRRQPYSRGGESYTEPGKRKPYAESEKQTEAVERQAETEKTATIEMPPIESFLQEPAERDGIYDQDAYRLLADTMSKALLPEISKWLIVQSEFGQLILGQYSNTLRDAWRSQVSINYTANKKAVERHFRAHIEAGGAPLEWTPWEAIEVLPLPAWVEELLGGQIVMVESRTYGERFAPILAKLIAHAIIYAEWDILTQLFAHAVIHRSNSASD